MIASSRRSRYDLVKNESVNCGTLKGVQLWKAKWCKIQETKLARSRSREISMIFLSLIEISLDLDNRFLEREANFGPWILQHLSLKVSAFFFIFRVGRIDLSLFIAWIHSSVRRKKIVFSKVSAFFYFYFSCGKNRCLSLFIAWNTLVSKKKENLLLWTV